nr:MAG TPA: hypothetical protein [Caudoviricetes sp.]
MSFGVFYFNSFPLPIHERTIYLWLFFLILIFIDL